MAKKSDKKKEVVVEPEAKEEIKHFCQNCKHHKNNPSMCKLDNKHIARKNPGCPKFKGGK